MYNQIIKDNRQWIEDTFARIDTKFQQVAVRSRDKLPYTSIEGKHDDYSTKDVAWWTNGFFGGMMWLLYERTKEQVYRDTAIKSESLLNGAFANVQELHHDVGFMWHILSGANYRLTGDLSSRNTNLLVANLLMARYNVEGDFIRCWNGPGTEGLTIIDCMMNIPLLYWAHRETGDHRYRDIAMRYADMAMRDHVRDDGSVNHIVVHDTHSVKVLGTMAGQGYSIGSSWSRGVSWALYGFTLSYIHTGKERYLEVARRVAKHFIEETKSTDWLPRLDFRQPATPLYYDSTAGAIASCGLIELARILPDDAEYYLGSALSILKAMDDKWCDYSIDTDSMLLMASERYTSGIHMPIIYGDYYYVEAITKLLGSTFLPW